MKDCYIPQTPAIQTLYQMINEDLRNGDKSTEILEYYEKLQRPQIAPLDLTEAKYKVQYWKRVITKKLIENFEETNSPLDDLNFLLKSGLKLSDDHIEKLFAKMATREEDTLLAQTFALLLAQQGNHILLKHFQDGKYFSEHEKYVGPEKILPIIANRKSKWTFDKWKNFSDFENYLFTEEGVLYRGIEFKTGDVILSCVNLDGNGVYTATSEPRNFAFHCGFFAIMEHEGKRFPVAMEIHELGLRAVPLNIFIAPHFNSYMEVFRLKEMTKDQRATINKKAHQATLDVKGYNFFTQDPDYTYLSCTTVGSYIYHLANVKPIQWKSFQKNERLRENIVSFGYDVYEFFAPVDYMIDERMEFVAVIDNDHFERNIVRELCERKFQHLFFNKYLATKKLPFIFKLNLWGIKHLQKKDTLGLLICYANGFTPDNFPKGPPILMSMIEIIEHALEDTTEDIVNTLREKINNLITFDMNAFHKDPDVQKVVEAAFNKKISKWFVDSL